MIKTLWLTSWYPNDLDNWNGDFIQRHAEAAALYCNVTVIHAEPDLQDLLKEPVVVKTNTRGNLTEKIILYKPARSKILIKLLNLRRYKRYFKSQVRKYIEENGLPQLVHVHVAMKAGMIALWIKRKYKIPYVITEHWTLYNEDSEDPYVTRNYVFKKFTQAIFKNAELVLPVSEDLGEVISRTVTPVTYKRLYNVVNTDHFNYSGFREDRPFTFIHVSSLNEQKNPQAIIEAFVSFHKSHPRSQLVMVGEVQGDLFYYILQQKLSANSVQFMGLVSYPKVAVLMQHSDALVLFSRYENMPCVVLEALCCGLPVIASATGGLAEVIHSDNGILVHEYTTSALSGAMIDLYVSYLRYNKQNIAAEARSNFSYDVIGKEIEAVYKDVLENASKK